MDDYAISEKTPAMKKVKVNVNKIIMCFSKWLYVCIEYNEKVFRYIPYYSHSLNLPCMHAVSISTNIVRFLKQYNPYLYFLFLYPSTWYKITSVIEIRWNKQFHKMLFKSKFLHVPYMNKLNPLFIFKWIELIYLEVDYIGCNMMIKLYMWCTIFTN